MTTCLFCRIVDGEVPADEVMRTEELLVFRDVAPQAPVHILLIPTAHYTNAAEMAIADEALTGRLLAVAGVIAEAEGLDDGYRIVFNTGLASGQSVFHVHAHLMGGRQMTWPPG